MTIRVHIERLVVHGLPLDTAGKAALLAAITAELGTAIAGHALIPELAGGGARPTLPGLSPITAQEASPRSIGRGVGGAVARMLAPDRSHGPTAHPGTHAVGQQS